ncbi:MAG: GNAT family N-acetyltransferase [Opitutus sp.]
MNPKRKSATKAPQIVLPSLHIPLDDFRAVEFPLHLKIGDCPTVLRFLRPGDEGRLVEFFESHAPETIHDRYGFSLHMSHEHAARLVGVDQSRDAALGVFEESPRAPLIAVGRYCLADDGKSAELAFVVQEDSRRLGIATNLLRLLVALARKRGLSRLTAQVHADNGGMLAVFRMAGATLTNLPGTGEIEGILEVGMPPGPI